MVRVNEEQELIYLEEQGVHVEVFIDTPHGDLIIVYAPDPETHHLVPRARELAWELSQWL